jgi:hypothetical protein
MAQVLRGLSKVENIYLGEGEGTAVLVGSCPHPRVYISAGHLFTGRGASQLFVTAKKAENSAFRRRLHDRRDKQSVARKFRRSDLKRRADTPD